jgi:hypothetical protein
MKKRDERENENRRGQAASSIMHLTERFVAQTQFYGAVARKSASMLKTVVKTDCTLTIVFNTTFDTATASSLTPLSQYTIVKILTMIDRL